MKKRITMPSIMACLFFLFSGLGLQAQGTEGCNANIKLKADEYCQVTICADNILQPINGPNTDYTVKVVGLPANATAPAGPLQNPLNPLSYNCITIDLNETLLGPTTGMSEAFDVVVCDFGTTTQVCWNEGWMVEDKTPPVIECPRNITIECTESTEPSIFGQFVKVSIPGPEYLSLAEVEVYSGGVNVAPAGTASQSPATAFGGVASRGNDGNTDGIYGNNSVTHTISAANPFWIVDLGSEMVIDEIRVFNRTDCCPERLDNYTLEILDAGMTSIYNSGPNPKPLPSAIPFLRTGLPTATDNCGTPELIYTDVVTDGVCPTDSYKTKITRTWYAKDAKGNTSVTCDQMIEVEYATLADVMAPPDYDGQPLPSQPVLECDKGGVEGSCDAPAVDPGWNIIVDGDFQVGCNCVGNPSPDEVRDRDGCLILVGTGYPTGTDCSNLKVTFEDTNYPICENSWKVRRTWTIVDWCTREDPIEVYQWILVSDTKAPEIDCPEYNPHYSRVESTSNSSCEANFYLVHPPATDNCSSEENISWSVAICDRETGSPVIAAIVPYNDHWIVNGLPIGEYDIKWTAEDDCENKEECRVPLEVRDEVAPTVKCESLHEVSLTGYTTNTATLVYAESFDDGSYDNCYDVRFDVRRIGSCIDFDWTTGGPGIDETKNYCVNNKDRGMSHTSNPAATDCEADESIEYYPKAPFACCDIGTDQIVELRVTEIIEYIDAYGQPQVKDGKSNTCMVTVSVKDYLPPVIHCPYDATINCTNTDNEPTNIPIDGLNQEGIGAPAFYVELNGPGDADDVITPVGYYANAYDNCEVTVYIRDEGQTNTCGITGDGEPLKRYYTAVDGDGREDECCQRITVVNPNPFTKDNIDWPDDMIIPGVDCSLDTDPTSLGSFPVLINLPDCHGAAVGVWEPAHDTRFDPENLTDDYCYKIVRKWYVADWCSTPDPGDICEYEQTIKVVDHEMPMLTCSATPITVNAGALVVASATATDNCTATSSLIISYEIDQFADGGFVASDFPVEIGDEVSESSGDLTKFPVGTHVIRFSAADDCGNVGTCDIIVEVDDVIDCDDIGTDPFPLDVGFSSSDITLTPDFFFVPPITAPIGSTVSVVGKLTPELGCSDIDQITNTPTDYIVMISLPGVSSPCERTVTVVDNTTPLLSVTSPFIIPGAGATGTINFVDYQDDLISTIGDNCTPLNQLDIAYSPASVECNGLTIIEDVTITVKDKFNHGDPVEDGNPISRTIAITVDCSTPPLASINVNGAIANEQNAMVANVIVSPATGMDEVMTDANGTFQFDLPFAENYNITPEKNDDYLNGVSTYDLVLISKHLLNIQKLNSPYKIIAGDVNKSGGITTLDMVELRKVILFINDEFPNNTSWRFVEANYVFPDATNPFAEIFPETYPINSLVSDMNDLDFVAVKIGDVNGTAATNNFEAGADDRDFNSTLQLSMNDARLSAGQTHTIEVTANDFNNMLGYQFTMSFDGLEVVEVLPGVLPNMTESNFGLQRLSEGVLTTSWSNNNVVTLRDGEVLFSLVVKANNTLTLSDAMRASSRYTTAEAYAENGAAVDLMDVNLAFRNETGIQLASQFELYQNRPNPFKDETVIGFDLPQSSDATLKVYDLSGRVLKQVDGAFQKGYNEVSINRSDLPGTGVLYYELSTGTNAAVRKMTIIE